jgi:uncharacterized protein (DUF111 family)
MRISHIGYGMGKKDFEAANCVRVSQGETADSGDETVELSCNLDDMTPEDIGFVQEVLMSSGALDVYTTAIGMKKCRPGVILSCICKKGDAEHVANIIFRHTTTLGIREITCQRYTLQRKVYTVQTEYGPVRIKKSWGYGVERVKPEYEDVARIAKEHNLPLSDVRSMIEKQPELPGL